MLNWEVDCLQGLRECLLKDVVEELGVECSDILLL